jgi:hypothetical protein
LEDKYTLICLAFVKYLSIKQVGQMIGSPPYTPSILKEKWLMNQF